MEYHAGKDHQAVTVYKNVPSSTYVNVYKKSLGWILGNQLKNAQ